MNSGMQRILIVGCSGAGKTTLSWALGKQLGLEVIHLDREYWRAGWIESPRPEFLVRLSKLLERDAWIMDGNYDSTLGLRMARADIAIFLDFSRWRCLSSVVWRTLTKYGRVRAEIPTGCPERFDWKFIHWIWNYRRTARPAILEHLQRFDRQGGKVVILSSRDEMWKWRDELAASQRS